MRKLLAGMLAAVLIFSLAACGGSPSSDKAADTANDASQTSVPSEDLPSSDGRTEDAPAQTEEDGQASDGRTADASAQTEEDGQAMGEENMPGAEETSEPAPEPEQSQMFVPNEDLQIVAAFVYENDTYAVVENTGSQAILNYRIAYINFDKNGFVASRDRNGYGKGKHDTANIMPGEKQISSWYGADGEYVVAAVIGVDYADGTSWDAKSMQIDRWAEETGKAFSLETHKAGLDSMKEAGALAETNEYAVLSDFGLKQDNQFSSNRDFQFSVENTSDQGILSLKLFVLQFDENGFPVSVSPYDTYCKNGRQTGGTVNLAAGSSDSYADDLFAQSSTTQVKAILSYIEFQDGTEWNNPYLYEWILSNSNTYES